MRVSLAVVHDEQSGGFRTFSEAQLPELLAALREADLVVGFNVRRFDYRVLRGYTDEDLTKLPTFDLLDAIHSRLGFRVALGHLAEETLGLAVAKGPGAPRRDERPEPLVLHGPVQPHEGVQLAPSHGPELMDVRRLDERRDQHRLALLRLLAVAGRRRRGTRGNGAIADGRRAHPPNARPARRLS